MKMDYGINFHLTVKGTQAADKLQAIAALSGWTCYQDNPFDDCYYFSIRTQKETYSSGTSDNVVKTYDYDDEVFCVTVPSGMIVVRYDDKVVVSPAEDVDLDVWKHALQVVENRQRNDHVPQLVMPDE